MIPTRSQTRWTSSSSCEERKTVVPRSRSSPTSARNSSCMSGSRPPVGSSRISSSGSWKKAWIRPIFWRLPRESSPSGRSRSAWKRSASCGARPRSAHAADLREEREELASGQPRVVREVPRQVSQPGSDRQAVAPRVEPEQASRAARRVKQVQERPDRRCLASAVRPEESEHLPGLDVHRDVLDATRVAIALGQTVGLYDGAHPRPSLQHAGRHKIGAAPCVAAVDYGGRMRLRADGAEPPLS